MCHALVLFIMGVTPTQISNPDGPQLIQTIEGVQNALRDVILVCEGEFKLIGPERLYEPRSVRPGGQYQGTYIHRSDGASLIEIYQRSSLQVESPLSIERAGTLRGQLQTQTLNPDRRRVPQKIDVSVGNAGSLDTTGAASRIILLWYFRMFSEQNMPSVSEVAWEMVEGHSCLRIRFDRNPGRNSKNKRTERFWIDMERGGNPLKIEWLAGEKVEMRTHDIRLEQHSAGQEGQVWLPTSGVVDSFVWGSDVYDEPIIREIYGVVRGSVRVNQNLPDRAFRLETASEFTGSPYLSQERREFKGEAKRFAGEPAEPITPSAIQARLDRDLAAADRQSQMLDASSNGTDSWFGLRLVQIGLGGLGVVTLLFVYWMGRSQ